MKDSRAKDALPLPVRRALQKLGEDVRIARKRRRLTMEIVAERALVSRKTLARVEHGDPGVSIGIYATVLFTLGLVDRLGTLADSSSDALGLTLADTDLPERVRRRSS